jgi:hypothetical protein
VVLVGVVLVGVECVVVEAGGGVTGATGVGADWVVVGAGVGAGVTALVVATALCDLWRLGFGSAFL